MSALSLLSNCTWRGVDPQSYPRMRDAIHVAPEDLLAMALKAHYTARRAMVPPDGQAWITDDRPYAIALDFHECLLHALTELLYLHAHKTGHFIEQGGAFPADLSEDGKQAEFSADVECEQELRP